MALDRTWYNSLVDDDGSGMTGSVWDKADVDSLMNAVDAEILRLDQADGINSGGGVWADWPITMSGNNGAVISGVGIYGSRYSLQNKKLTVSFYISFNITIAAPTILYIALPLGKEVAHYSATVGFISDGTTFGIQTAPNTATVSLYRSFLGNLPWPIGSGHTIAGTHTFEIK